MSPALDPSTIIISACKSVISFWLLLITGLICGKLPLGNPILTKNSTKNLSNIAYYLCVPLFVFDHFASGLTMEALLSSWMLPFYSLANVLIGLLISRLIAPLFAIPKENMPFFMVCSSLPNFSTMPFVLMNQICHFGIFPNLTFGQCYDRSVITLFLYDISLYIMTYGVFWSYLEFSVPPNPIIAASDSTHSHRSKKFDDEIEEEYAEEEKNKCWELTKNIFNRSFGNPPVLGLLWGIFFALVLPLRNSLYSHVEKGEVVEASLEPIATGIALFSSSAIPLLALVLAGIFVDPVSEAFTCIGQVLCRCCKKKSASSSSEMNKSPSTDDVRVETHTVGDVTVTSSKNEVEINPMLGMVANGGADATTVAAAAAAEQKSDKYDALAGLTRKAAVAPSSAHDAAPSSRTRGRQPMYTFPLLLVRLFLAPAAAFGMLALFKSLHWTAILPPDQVSTFIVILASGLPAAQAIAVLLKQMGLEDAASALSTGFISTYAVSTVSLTVVIILGLQYVLIK